MGGEVRRTFAAATPHEAAKAPRRSLACVGNDDDVRAVASGGNGAFHGMEPRRVSSITPLRRRRSQTSSTRQLASRGSHFLDAPVSGGQSRAEQGMLTVMVGGDAASLRKSAAGDRALRARSDADRARPARNRKPKW